MIQNQEHLTQLIQQGIAAIKDGNKDQGWNLLGQALKSDPHNQTAWMWMASATDDPQEQVTCLEKVVAINPNNEAGKRAAARLNQLQSTKTAASPPLPQPTQQQTPPPPQPAAPSSSQKPVPRAPADTTSNVPQKAAHVPQSTSPMDQTPHTPIKVRGNTGLLTVIALLLFLLVLSNVINLAMAFQQSQERARRAEIYRDVTEDHREIILDIMDDYRADAYLDPDIDRIAEQQLIAAEYILQMQQVIALQNTTTQELLLDSP